MDARWSVRPQDPVAALAIAERLGVLDVTAGCLVGRGVATPEAARAFLEPRIGDLLDPFLLPGMEAAAARVVAAIRGRERVVVWGDYDVDGVTATALLLRFFRLAGADAGHYLPHRSRDGYGMNAAGVRRLAEEGARLVITVDNGITAVDEVALARSLGMDVLITDHHEPGPTRPDACAVINPKIHDPLTGAAYPFPGISGVGVAFKLAWAVAQRLSAARRADGPLREFLLDSMALVAVGTIADMAPLVGENRVVVAYGLRALAASRNPGLQALLAGAMAGGRPVDAEGVGFRIAPRINAAGRVGEPELALRLLTTDDEDEAQRLAGEVDVHNRHRQEMERATLAEARILMAGLVSQDRMTAPVLASDGWHPGVIGIVAGRLMEEFRRPVLMVALAGDVGTGSARGIPEVPLHDLIGRCRSHLLTFGGHASAAGFRIRREAIPAFQEALDLALGGDAGPLPGAPEVVADIAVGLDRVDRRLVDEISRLEPFGQGNRPPLFLAEGVRVAGGVRRIGKRGDHLSFLARQGDRTLKAVAFGMGERAEGLGAACDILYRPVLNRWQGREEVEIEVKGIRRGP